MSPSAQKFMNREISWLSFNERVLQEAADPSVPLIERLKFMGIYSSNLDEFFRVRVGSLKRMIDAGIKSKAVFGGTPKKILNEIQKKVITLNDTFDRVFASLQDELKKEKIFIINEMQLNDEQQSFVRNYFKQEVRSRLVPIMLDSVPTFPYLKNQVIYLVVNLVRNHGTKERNAALIEVPADLLPRFVELPKINDNKYIIMLDDVIRLGLQDIFSIFNYDEFSAYTIKLTRDAELDIDDDVTKSFYEKIAKSVKKREEGQPVRFVYDRKMPNQLLQYILKHNDLLEFENIIPGGRYHNARDFMHFPNVGTKHLEYKRIAPLEHRTLRRHKSMFDAIRERDILLHYPYQSFHYVIDLLREAAIDPKVTSIKITLYRVARYSNVINALINASRNGKNVTVVMELQARFDEEANIYWTEKLEEEGVRIIDGVPGLKVHAKLFLITRREGGKNVFYANVGTGNFNESTAQIYCDHALLTADTRITQEVNKLFRFLKNNYKTYNYRHLLVAPFFMRKRFSKLIRNEIKNAKAGKEAYIWVKLNSLVDGAYINELYAASKAGVKIKMMIRGICSLVPGIEGLSDNIEVYSIVDKYLEHSRLFVFANGGDEQFFISSADWMIRNLDNRVEVAAPIYDPDIQCELKHYLEIQFRDTTKARIINQQQENLYRPQTDGKAWRTQDEMYHFLKAELRKSED
ncbi:polyphosphate kinase 1 [candidate division KSB1 bacterium]|nr:polyphosphate kinase 1 [candidate division KSB1 bacterium]